MTYGELCKSFQASPDRLNTVKTLRPYFSFGKNRLAQVPQYTFHPSLTFIAVHLWFLTCHFEAETDLDVIIGLRAIPVMTITGLIFFGSRTLCVYSPALLRPSAEEIEIEYLKRYERFFNSIICPVQHKRRRLIFTIG